MICLYCRTNNPPQAVSCKVCGKPMTGAEAAPDDDDDRTEMLPRAARGKMPPVSVPADDDEDRTQIIPRGRAPAPAPAPRPAAPPPRAAAADDDNDRTQIIHRPPAAAAPQPDDDDGDDRTVILTPRSAAYGPKTSGAPPAPRPAPRRAEPEPEEDDRPAYIAPAQRSWLPWLCGALAILALAALVFWLRR